VALQEDGKVVVTGTTSAQGFTLARYAGDGSLDSSFGMGGVVNASFSTATDVAIQANGKIVAAGSAGSRFALARYNLDGTLDGDFGGDGKVTTGFRGDRARINGIAVQTDGKIVAAGATTSGRTGKLAIAQYRGNGALSTSFGGDGKVASDLTAGQDTAKDVGLQANGRIVVAGSVERRLDSRTFAVVRFRRDGQLDTSFGQAGRTVTKLGHFSEARALVVQPDGRIVAAGFASPQSPQFAIVRYKASGELDTSFGIQGKLRIAFGSFDFCNDLAVQPDGRIIAVGSAEVVYETQWAFALTRLLAT
jgi:uncharacterized delta-60 repeat protein